MDKPLSSPEQFQESRKKNECSQSLSVRRELSEILKFSIEMLESP